MNFSKCVEPVPVTPVPDVVPPEVVPLGVVPDEVPLVVPPVAVATFAITLAVKVNITVLGLLKRSVLLPLSWFWTNEPPTSCE